MRIMYGVRKSMDVNYSVLLYFFYYFNNTLFSSKCYAEICNNLFAIWLHYQEHTQPVSFKNCLVPSHIGTLN